MKKFAIIHRQDQHSTNVANRIKNELIDNNFEYDDKNPALIITVGGDGTLLYAVHQYINQINELHFLAVHTGTLGFYTDYTEENLNECIQDIIKGKIYEVFESPLLEIHLEGKNVDEYHYALNEMRIENVLRTQTVDVYIDNEFFEKFKGNGMCLSTQAGSTAYSRALNGAIVDSGLRVLQLSEIAGIHNHQHNSLGNSYLMREDRTVTFVCQESTEANICYDHLHKPIDTVDTITCKLSNKTVKFARFRKYSYLRRLRNLY